MRALTLWQPWASAVAWRLKRFETRSWATKYRGALAIHAAKRKPLVCDLERLEPWLKALLDDLPLGKVVAVVELVECFEMTGAVLEDVANREAELGDWRLGRFAWPMGVVRRLDRPVAAKGRQRIWIPRSGERVLIERELARST